MHQITLTVLSSEPLSVASVAAHLFDTFNDDDSIVVVVDISDEIKQERREYHKHGDHDVENDFGSPPDCELCRDNVYVRFFCERHDDAYEGNANSFTVDTQHCERCPEED